MNYPIWDVAFGAGMLIAAVANQHVFVHHHLHFHADLRKLGEEPPVLEGPLQSHVLPVAGPPHVDCVRPGGRLRAGHSECRKNSAPKVRIVRCLMYDSAAQLSLPMRGQGE